MNVIVSNQNKNILDNLNVDIIRTLDGEYEVEEIINTFSNFFFNKMFLDITAIKGYENLSTIQKLSMSLDVEKIIILLNNNEIVNSNNYLSGLVSMGIYNFASNIEDLMYLYNNPNSYKDVAHYQQINNNISTNNYVTNNNKEQYQSDVKVIGIKNITSNAGATSLTYMLNKCLLEYYSVKTIEVNKSDFLYYRDKSLISVSEKNLIPEINKHSDVNIILLDLNDLEFTESEKICNDIIYLIEPSLIKINKLIMLNKNILHRINEGKIIINKSFFNEKDIKDFEEESGLKIFYNIPNLNDRLDNTKVLLPLLEKLGLLNRK